MQPREQLVAQGLEPPHHIETGTWQAAFLPCDEQPRAPSS